MTQPTVIAVCIILINHPQHCQVVADYTGEEVDDSILPPARIHYQTFTPLFGTLILSSNGNVSETARCSITTILERIKKADDKDTLARGDRVRPPLPPENLWKAPAQDYAMDDPEVEEEELEVGIFGPEERTRVKHEILAAIVVALGRLDSLCEEGDAPDGSMARAGQSVDDRRSLLEAQSGDGVQVVSPDELSHENGVTTSTDLEASPSNVIIKEDTVNPYFPIVPSAFSTPSSTSSTPSTSNSTSSSSGSSPTVPATGVSSSSPLEGSSGSTTGVPSHSRSPPSQTSENTLRLQEPSGPLQDANVLESTSQRASSESSCVPAFLQPRRLCRPKGPLAYQLNLGNMIHEEEEDVYYDEQATNGRWSTMRLVAAIVTSGEPC